ncbi:MAG: FimB/Mfa2 family fimbrial subunit [Muribaculaceae bacterium]|nr:FimB/Mfa2 family fimbrial subunit [Muribaculaceae bacterium]
MIKNSALSGFACIMLMSLGGCDSQIYDDLEPCHTDHYLKFRYDYNMKFADAFPSEVVSVAVWAFDTDGRLAWQHQETGEGLSSVDYRVEFPLAPGKYDFVTWCGYSSDSPFKLDSETPRSISELGMTLTRQDQALSGLYHDIRKGVEITDNPNTAGDVEIVFSLTKDTNYFKILLQNLDGTEMKEDDFSFRITRGNCRLEYDNSIGNGETADYLPWKVTASEATIAEDADVSEGTVTSVSGVLAELHTSRLMADARYRLVVTRNDDLKEIINIPLIDYLLLIKGNYRRMTDQEYLDRQDEFSMTFFLDKNNNWMNSIGIYVNAWHVVPPQDTPLE